MEMHSMTTADKDNYGRNVPNKINGSHPELLAGLIREFASNLLTGLILENEWQNEHWSTVLSVSIVSWD